MTVKKIEILKSFGFRELEEKLRNVSLRGFPDVKIYENADIGIICLTPEQVRKTIFTPQPSVYTPELDKVSKVAELFSKKGIDIFRLKGGIDYIAEDEKKEITEWTMIPPVVEVLEFEFDDRGKLNYSNSIGERLKKQMNEKEYEINPEVRSLMFDEYLKNKGKIKKLPEICDGSHRIELAVRDKRDQNLLFVEGIALGFPYYAAPKPYSVIHEEPERIEERLDKTHVLTPPGHKILYRLFPIGGIKSGDIRPIKENYD